MKKSIPHSENNHVHLFDDKLSTAALKEKLDATEDISEFLKVNNSNFVESPFHVYLNNLLNQTGISRSKIALETGINTSYIYEVFDGKKKPGRDKLIAICFAMHLDTSTTQRILKLGGCSELYPRDKRDNILYFAIRHHWDINKVDDELNEAGLETLRGAE